MMASCVFFYEQLFGSKECSESHTPRSVIDSCQDRPLGRTKVKFFLYFQPLNDSIQNCLSYLVVLQTCHRFTRT